jgi:hypothetical protein
MKTFELDVTLTHEARVLVLAKDANDAIGMFYNGAYEVLEEGDVLVREVTGKVKEVS